MKCYTLVTIIQLDTGASGMYRISAPGWWKPWKHGSIPTASLSHSSYFHLHSLPFPFNKITLKACSICLITHLTFILFFYARADNRGTCEGQVWVSRLFSSCWWFPLCQSPKQAGNIQFNVTFLCSSLTASTRAQVKFQIRNPFYPQWCNHSTYSPFPESNSSASKGCSIEYLWVTGLGNSV